MGIEKIGESILSNVRAQNAKTKRSNRKRQTRDDLWSIFGGVAVGVGNSLLKRSTESFLQNKEVYDSIALHKNATQVGASAFAEVETINKSGKSQLQWQMDSLRPSFEAGLKEKTPNLEEGTDYFNTYVTENLRPLAQNIVDARNNLVADARTLKDTPTYNSEVAKKIQRASPSSVGQYVTNGLANLFSGKSSAQIELESRESILKSPQLQNAERVKEFKEEYERTKDVVAAFDFANAVVPVTPKEERTTSRPNYEVLNLGGKIVLVEQEIDIDTFTKKETKSKVPEVTTLEEKDVDKSVVLKARQSAFNFSKDGNTMLNQDHFKNFLRDVQDKGITLPAKTNADQDIVAKLFQTATLKKGALRDKFADGVAAALVGAALSEELDVNDPIGAATSISQSGREIREALTSTQDRNKHRIENYDELNSSAQAYFDSMTAEEYLLESTKGN